MGLCLPRSWCSPSPPPEKRPPSAAARQTHTSSRQPRSHQHPKFEALEPKTERKQKNRQSPLVVPEICRRPSRSWYLQTEATDPLSCNAETRRRSRAMRLRAGSYRHGTKATMRATSAASASTRKAAKQSALRWSADLAGVSSSVFAAAAVLAARLFSARAILGGELLPPGGRSSPGATPPAGDDPKPTHFVVLDCRSVRPGWLGGPNGRWASTTTPVV